MTSAEVVGSRPSRRERTRLIVPVDCSKESTEELVRALRDALRHDGEVLACAVVERGADDAERARADQLLAEQVRRAVEVTGVCGRTETALIEPAVLAALCGTARGGTLVVVQSDRRTVLRSAPLRAPVRAIVRPG